MQDNIDNQTESETPENTQEPEAIEAPTEQETPEAQDGPSSKTPRHSEGDPLTFIRVRFPGNARSQPFLVGSRDFQYGQKVMAMSDRGMTVGYINSFPYSLTFKKDMLPLKSISKVATEEDIKEQSSFIKQERKAETSCKRLIENYKLDMIITHVEFIQFGKKAVFYFNAPSRVDFRDLVKSLVGELKMRIELRQISVRDRTAALGAIGSCGLQTCCSSFLKNYGNVNIKMAKNQNLALIPSKLNGVCGQIKCCIKYEDNVYAEKRKRLPHEGSFVKTVSGDKGKVTKLHILLEHFEILTDKGVFKRYTLSQYDPTDKLPAEWKFPERFNHITNETSAIIGLVDDALVKGSLFYENVDDFDADEYLESLSDDETEEIEEADKMNVEEQETKKELSPKMTDDPYHDEHEESDNSEPNFNREEFNKSEEIDARDNKRLGGRGNRSGSSNNKNRNNKNQNRRPNNNRPEQGNGNSVGNKEGEGGEGNNNNRNNSRNKNRNRNRNRNKNRNSENKPASTNEAATKAPATSAPKKD